MKKILIIATIVALFCASAAYGATQVLRAVSELDAPGTVYQNRVELANGNNVNCLFFRDRESATVTSMSCDWERMRIAP
jgi:hypothetical protein